MIAVRVVAEGSPSVLAVSIPPNPAKPNACCASTNKRAKFFGSIRGKPNVTCGNTPLPVMLMTCMYVCMYVNVI